MDCFNKGKLSDIDVERETECGICMETNSKVVLPNCSHSLCFKCFRDWHGRSQSCPFCRDSLKEVNVTDLWMCIEASDIVDMSVIMKENKRRLFVYIERLPLIIPSTLSDQSDSHLR